MPNRVRFVPATILIVVAQFLSPAWARGGVTVDYTPSTIVVKLVPSKMGPGHGWTKATGRPDFDRLLREFNLGEARQLFSPKGVPERLREKAESLRLGDYVTIPIPNAIDSDVLRRRLEGSPDVLRVDRVPIARIDGSEVTPNDTYFPTHQYTLRNTGAQPPYDPGTSGADAEMEAGWDITTGDSATIIAIIDTGTDITHPEFANRLWINPNEEFDEFDNDGNGLVDDVNGYDFANNDGVPYDDHMHGTHVSGIAAATGNNGIGIAGMNWRCRIMAIKVLDANGSGTFADIAEGVTYAVNKGADVINLSLGGPGNFPAMETAIAYAVSAGVIVCAATGNDNSGNLFYPAAYDSVFSIGATNSRDERALGDLCPFAVDGSNFGPWIDVVAGGDVVWSTFPLNKGSYGSYCLTSMASPHVAGLATLVLALRPNYGADSVRRIIRRGAEDEVGSSSEDTPGFDVYFGYGRINGRVTLQALAYSFPPIITVPGPQFVTEGQSLVFTVSAFDSNLTDPVLTSSSLANSSLLDYGDGTASFGFDPDNDDAGVHIVTFIASDGVLADTAEVEITVLDGCACDCFADPGACDGSQDLVDVVQTINVAFRGATPILDPNSGCPVETTDVNCSTATDVVDVVRMTNVAFRGADASTEFCDPCP